MSNAPVFDVDKKGLAKLLERRGKEFAVLELWQNAADEDGVTEIEMTLERMDPRHTGDQLYVLKVRDDAPEGFADLKHAYTLFAESKKKSRADQRGRFNLGEKLVIAICDTVRIATTKGVVTFTESGREEHGSDHPDTTEAGSEFSGVLRMSEAEYTRAVAAIHQLIVPEGIRTTLNGTEIESRQPLKTFTQSLRTELADAEGYLRPTRRKTTVGVYEVREGEKAMLYEMGIPVVETDDTWHIDIGQKVPLTTDRDNVPPGYLKDVRAAVLNNCNDLLTEDAATSKWVDDALEHKDVKPEAVKSVITERFGEKAVIDDKTDPEGTKIAMQRGYTVIPGGAFSRSAWKNVKATKAVLPAGKVTPSPNPNEGEGKLQEMQPEHYPEGVRRTVDYARALARELLGVEIEVRVATAITWPYVATYGPRPGGGMLTLNYGRLGHKIMQGRSERIDALLIHEFAHHKVRDHLTSDFYDECCRLGAKMVQLAVEQPELLTGFDAKEAVAA